MGPAAPTIVAHAAVALLVLLGLEGCGAGEEARQEDLLLLHRRIPLGATRAEVERAFPSAGPRHAEGTGRTALCELRGRAELLGVSAGVEFAFRGDSLGAVFFHPEPLPPVKGEALFEQLVRFYSDRLGPARIAEGSARPHFVKVLTWPAAGCEVNVIMSIEASTRQVGWGYQPRTARAAAVDDPRP